MHSPHIEERTVASLTALALDVAQQLGCESGKAAVVCEQPEVLASLVSKQWPQLLHAIEREYAGTRNAQKREELSQKIAWMRSRTFSAAGKADQLETSKTDVLFCAVEVLLRYAPVCHTMYITYPIDQRELYLITAWMPLTGTVIRYRMAPRHKKALAGISW